MPEITWKVNYVPNEVVALEEAIKKHNANRMLWLFSTRYYKERKGGRGEWFASRNERQKPRNSEICEVRRLLLLTNKRSNNENPVL